MALYRLRQLTPGVDLVVRGRNGLRLATIEEGVSTDVGMFLVADLDDPMACEAAVRSYGDDFGATQLAAEDFAIDTRRWLRARFMLLTTRVLEAAHRRGTEAVVVDLALRVREAAFEDAQLATAVVAVLANAGRRSDARLLERRLTGS
jgi:DNA-binding SARP family transcriptional activator